MVRRSKKQEKKNIRQAIFFTFLSIVMILALFFVGIPLLVRLSIFLGDLRSQNDPIVSEDVLPPQTPVLEPLPDATNENTIKVSGYTEKGATVKVYLNGIDKKETVANEEGKFSIDNLELYKGENKINAKAIDSSANESDFSPVKTVVVDKKEPELEIVEPEEGKEYFGDQDSVNISGKTDPEASVIINDIKVIVNSEGEFSTVMNLSEDENVFKIIATDPAGNKTEKEIKVNYSS